MQTTLKNRSIFCADNLEVLRGVNDESVDLIYLDPPFNKNKVFTSLNGSKAKGASFRDIFRQEDVKKGQLSFLQKKHPQLAKFIDSTDGLGNSYNKYYLIYMTVRLLEMHRVLKQTGSIWLHCDPTMSHYLKLVLDGIFGENNFRNEIVWCYTGPSTSYAKQFPRKHDILFWYNKGDSWVFNKDNIKVPYKDGAPHTGGLKALTKARSEEYGKKGKTPESWWSVTIACRIKKEWMGYPTQKPLKLLERIIQASTNEGDIVLDPFCGCATACVAAERLGRQWIGIDVLGKAYELVQYRLKKEVVRTDEIFKKKVFFREGSDAYVQRTDLQADTRPKREIKKSLYGDQGGYCNLCDHHFAPRHLEIDHILARAKGGGDNYANLQLLCGSCNRIKSNRTMAEAQVVVHDKRHRK